MAWIDTLAKVTEIIPDSTCLQCRHVEAPHKGDANRVGSTGGALIGQLSKFPPQRKIEYKAGESQDLIAFVKAINGEREEAEEPPKRKRGRKVKNETVLFMKFTNSKGTMPKKEYIRIKILRGLRKVIRKYSYKEARFSGINKVRELQDDNESKLAADRAWMALIDFYGENIHNIDVHFRDIDFNGRNKEGNFNNEYCKRVLDSPVIKKLYKLYIGFLFADLDPDLMCSKFNVKCCRGCHANECIDKWRELHTYLEKSMLTELGMEDEAQEAEALKKVKLKEDSSEQY
mmetsp:Transcript_19583/g.35941  ORF Transcript_19583/g.35941 Transcript_19583/m.35941 type:complete len:288 (-) Transcript_19583:2608-3471(-)